MLEAWAATMRAAGLSERTISERLGVVTRLVHHARLDSLDELTPIAVIAWLGREGLSSNTRATYFASLVAFDRWRCQFGHASILTGVPAARRKRGEPRPVTDDELRRLLAACTRQRTRDYVAFAAFAGLRVHEIAKLHTDDFHADTDGWTLDVVGKGGQFARIPLASSLDLLVRRHLAAAPGWLFPSPAPHLQHVTAQAVSDAIHQALMRAQIPAATPHSLRHWYGSTLLAKCGNLRTVQTLMRHSSIQSTERYCAVSHESQRAALELLAA